MKVTMILKGRSFFKIVLSVLNEAKKAQIPTTIKPLKILEPIILLKAISLFPVNHVYLLMLLVRSFPLLQSLNQ